MPTRPFSVLALVACAVALASCGSARKQQPPPAAAPFPAAAPEHEAAAAAPADGPRAAPRPDQLGEFWAPWFAGPYEYMFVGVGGRGWEDAPAAASKGRVFGGGISGFYFYGGLDDCLRAWMGEPQEYGHDEYASLSRMAGAAFRTGTVGQGWDRSFGRYDPAVIEWALKTLVPHPSRKLGDRTFQDVYDESFFRVVRLHLLAYAALRTEYDLDAEAAAYVAAMTDEPDFYGVEWLENRYAGALADAYPLAWDGTSLTAPMVLGFWLRRHVDGTEATLVRGMDMIVRAYDPAWAASHPDEMALLAAR